jgi:hypothetical protein
MNTQSSKCSKKTVTLTYRGVKYKSSVRPLALEFEEIKVGTTV